MKTRNLAHPQRFITFSVTKFYDPFGDAKSTRKVFTRKFYAIEKSEIDCNEIQKIIEHEGYYNEVRVEFKPYQNITVVSKDRLKFL